jgi:hypothetical protein
MKGLNMRLEEELEKRILTHKIRVLTAKLAGYYIDLNESGVKLPMTPEDVGKIWNYSNREVNVLRLNNPEHFDQLYSKAWEEMAEELC